MVELKADSSALVEAKRDKSTNIVKELQSAQKVYNGTRNRVLKDLN